MLLTELNRSFQRQVRQLNSWTLGEFLKECGDNKQLVVSTASSMHTALGTGVRTSTSSDPRLHRLFGDRVLTRYSAFEDFYGLGTVIEEIAQYYYLAAQGLAQRKKILCLIGPPGTAKSMLANRIKQLFGQTSMHVLAVKKESGFELSPVFEHPFDLFNREEHGELLKKYAIKPYQLGAGGPSPWAWEHLQSFEGDITQFHVVQVPCSVGQQVGIARIEPQTDQELDVSVLIGARNQDGSYRYTGGLNRAGQGILEFVEMFKVKPDVLRPLLTAMEEGFYSGNDGIGPIPFRGMILCHSNWDEWEAFKGDKKNKGLVDRTFLIEVPYCMQLSEEEKIYERMLRESELGEKPRAPYTTKTLARLTVLSRLRPTGGTIPTIGMMRVYDGEDPEKVGDGVKTLAQYLEGNSPSEGREGISTRSGFQIISAGFTADPKEIGIDPELLLEEALKVIARDYAGKASYKKFVEELLKQYLESLERDIQLAYAKTRGGDTPQDRFNRYEELARHWSYDEVYKVPGTGSIWDREQINQELTAIEKAMEIKDPANFREKLVKHCLRYRETLGEKAIVPLETYEPMRELIETKMRSEGGNLAQVIAFGDFKRDTKVETAHDKFVAYMVEQGYSKRQTERLVGWYMAEKKLSFHDPVEETKKE